MLKLNHLIVFVIVILIFSCNNKDAGNSINKVVELNIKTAELIEMEDIIENVRCIKLENISPAFFNDCWKIRLYDKYIYIYSLTDFAVYIFSKDGKYLNKLNTSSKGSLTMPVDILLNKSKNELWVINDRRTLNFYSLDGSKYLGNIELPFETTAISCYDDDKFLLYDGNFNAEIPGYIVLTKLIAGSKPVFFAKKNKEKKFISYIPPTLFTKTKHNIIYTLLPLNDTIYISNPDLDETFKPLYYLNFEDDFLNEEKWPVRGYTDKEYAEMMKSAKYIYSINSFYSANDKIFFKTKGKDSLYFMINTITNQLFTFNKLIDDLHTRTPATSIQGSLGNDIFFIFDAKYLINHYKQKGIKTSYPEIEKTVKNLSENDNKVIFICTVK